MSEKYEELIKSIELSNIKLYSLECKQNPTFVSTERQLDVAFEYTILEVEYEGMDLKVQIGFSAISFKSDDTIEDNKGIPEEDKLFQISCVFELSYKLELDTVEDVLEGFTDEVQQFVDQNVPVNAWPYARETISSLTTRMGFPPLFIPTFKRVPKL